MYCSFAVNGIYLKLSKCIVPGISEGTSVCSPVYSTARKKCKCIIKTWNYRHFISVPVRIIYLVGMPNTLQHHIRDIDWHIIPDYFGLTRQKVLSFCDRTDKFCEKTAKTSRGIHSPLSIIAPPW